MKRSIIITFLCLSAFSFSQAEDEAKPTSPVDRFSYAVGMDIANGMKSQGIELNKELFIQGLSEAMDESTSPMMTQAEAREALIAFQGEIQQKQEKLRASQVTSNQKEAATFLSSNKEKEGITTLDSGLQYQVLEEGDGEKPLLSDSVTVHYTGTLLDGTVFDSSVERGQPASFPLTGVIPGWTEGLQLMKQGAKYKFFIPSDLAYGERGAGQLIGPNAALVFDVELISIN